MPNRKMLTGLHRGAVGAALAVAVGAAVAPGIADARPAVPPRVGAGALPTGTVAKLDRALRRTWGSTWSPGVIAGVWIGSRGWTATLGATRRAAGPAPRPADRTRVGSITKTMLGTVLLRLVDQGRLQLDESIAQWFPQIPDAGQITIRELADMGSGIASYTGDPALVGQYFANPTMPFNADTLIAAGAALPRKFLPGQGFDYSDTNFVMLGRIVEQVTGQPLSEVMHKLLFAPLGMSGSLYPTDNRIPKPYLNGYTVQGSVTGNPLDATAWTPTFAAGAGQAISTLPDLHKLAVALGTGKLLKPATQRQRLRPNPFSVGDGRAYLLALGLDHGWLSHQGQIPGYNTEIAYLPKLKATVVVIADADIADASGLTPAARLYSALAKVIAPGNVPTG
jgi:D-alanyl-D-alanine carboxypeptidase